MVVAAVGIGVASAAATAYAGHEAAGATKDAARAAMSEQDKALAQQSQLSQPYRDLGSSAIPQLQSLLGLNGQDPTATLRNTPGYKFQQQQGQQNTVNAASAQGLSLSGNTLEGLAKFNQGLADTTYQQAVGNAQNAVNTGQSAAAGQSANVGSAAANKGNILENQGNTLAGIYSNEAAGIAKSIGNAGNQYMTDQTLQGLQNPNSNAANWDTENPNNFQDFQPSDRRLKTDIQLVGKLDSGLNVYMFRYVKAPEVVHMGVMADEVEKVIPEAVSTDDDGYQQVCYAMLGGLQHEVA